MAVILILQQSYIHFRDKGMILHFVVKSYAKDNTTFNGNEEKGTKTKYNFVMEKMSFEGKLKF